MVIRAFVNHANANMTIPLLKNAPFLVSKPNLVDLIHDLHEPRSKGGALFTCRIHTRRNCFCSGCQNASNKYCKFHSQHVRTENRITRYALQVYSPGMVYQLNPFCCFDFTESRAYRVISTNQYLAACNNNACEKHYCTYCGCATPICGPPHPQRWEG